jgi:hypothetical protein
MQYRAINEIEWLAIEFGLTGSRQEASSRINELSSKYGANVWYGGES